MKPHILIFTLLTLAVTGAMAQTAVVGEKFPPYTLEDQFGNPASLSPDTRYVIIASEKAVSGKVNTWLKAKEQGYLPTHKAEYVSDIEPMPGIITTLFALPKMKKYPFTLLLNREKQFAATYPAEKGKIALFVLDEAQAVTAIHYVDAAEELDAFIK
jgi:hypothetical protein